MWLRRCLYLFFAMLFFVMGKNLVVVCPFFFVPFYPSFVPFCPLLSLFCPFLSFFVRFVVSAFLFLCFCSRLVSFFFNVATPCFVVNTWTISAVEGRGFPCRPQRWLTRRGRGEKSSSPPSTTASASRTRRYYCKDKGRKGVVSEGRAEGRPGEDIRACIEPYREPLISVCTELGVCK